ncbi:putative Major facilitator superfamily transporter [Seiridium unicorne]|uniref:Major facilitator superfamily transporter n=1 Tax=Seiridium unicorne TaxID=138068 RepID=A0ABR2UEY1_9PEZI
MGRLYTSKSDDAVETAPLLNSGDGAASATTHRPRRDRTTSIASMASINVPQARNPNTILAIICGLIFVAAGSGGFFTIPMTRIFEDRFCQEYYSRMRSRDEPIDEDLCKVDIIQSRLSTMFAVNSFIEAAIGCLVAMPWGFVADRYVIFSNAPASKDVVTIMPTLRRIGRRPVFTLTLLGMATSGVWQMAVGWFTNILPIQLYWLGPLGLLIGGGNAVLNSTLSSIMSDILPEPDRAIGFMRIHAASMLGNLCSPAISAALMPRVGAWPLLFVSLVLTVGSAIAMLFVPETLGPKPEIADVDSHQNGNIGARLSHSLAELKDSLSMLKNGSVVLLMLANVTVMPVIYCTLQFLSQFVSKRYHIKLADTGFIQGSYGALHVLIILIVIPYLSELAMRPTSPRWIRMADEKQRDLTFVRWSFVALTLGSLLMAFSPAPPVFICGLFILGFGSGAGSYISSILAFCVDKEHRTRMFSLLGITQIVGSLYAMPMLAGLFTVGMKLGGFWTGLPYLGVAAQCAAAIVLVAFVRLYKTVKGGKL